MAEYDVDLHGSDEEGWGASVPDLGVFATAPTREQVIADVQAAAQFHVEGLVEDGIPLPPASPPVRVAVHA